MDEDSWLRCSACKEDIAYRELHWVCSVSTCNRNRTRLVFCSVQCWDSHVAILRHRDAWAVEQRAPSREAWMAELAAEEAAGGPTIRQPPVRNISAATAPPSKRVPEAVPARATPPSPSAVAKDRVVPTPLGASADRAGANALSADYDRDILIVVSKMKKYIRDRSGMNCSDSIAEALSDHVRNLCDDAIRTAGSDGRKTVLDRDMARVSRPSRGS